MCRQRGCQQFEHGACSCSELAAFGFILGFGQPFSCFPAFGQQELSKMKFLMDMSPKAYLTAKGACCHECFSGVVRLHVASLEHDTKVHRHGAFTRAPPTSMPLRSSIHCQHPRLKTEPHIPVEAAPAQPQSRKRIISF